MGLCSRYKSLTCDRCSMHCQIMQKSHRVCSITRKLVFLYVTEESSYFNSSGGRYLNKKPQCEIKRIYFCRFLVSFLRLFLEKDWIDYLQVLTSDA